MPKYYADLFAWALHQGQWAAHKQVASMAASALAKEGTAFDEVAHHIALTDMKVLLGAPTFRIKLLVCAMKQLDPSFKSVLSSYYGAANAWWGSVYEEILSAAGRRLRDEVDLVTFAMSMTALEEGLALRYLGNPEAFKSDLTVAAKALSVGALVAC